MRTAGLAAIAIVGLSMISACTTMQTGGADGAAMIASAVADPARPAEDVARDAARKPGQIVAFADVAPGDVIAELVPGGGYYTRILSRAVGPSGKVYALVPARMAERPGAMDAINAIASQYGNVDVVTVSDYAALTLPQPVDLVWTTENYHDLANGDIAAVNRWAYGALRAGGAYFVEDHSAPGTGTSATSTLHRIDPAAVVSQVTAAGFMMAAQSDLLRNSADPHDVPPFNMQPTSDKFALRFRKPG